MVFSLITLAATVPLLATSTLQLQNESQKTKDNSEDQIKTQKCLLKAQATVRMSQRRHDQLKDMICVVRDGAIYLDKADSTRTHPFMGYLLPFPDAGYDGVVTTINDENFLNWTYIDKDTYQFKHGVRKEAQSQITGPANVLPGHGSSDWRIGYFGWEGFVAVMGQDGTWAVYFDREDNGLKGKVSTKDVVEIELVRVPIEDVASASSAASMSSGTIKNGGARSESQSTTGRYETVQALPSGAATPVPGQNTAGTEQSSPSDLPTAALAAGLGQASKVMAATQASGSSNATQGAVTQSGGDSSEHDRGSGDSASGMAQAGLVGGIAAEHSESINQEPARPSSEAAATPSNQAQGAINLGAAFAAGVGEGIGSDDLDADEKKGPKAAAQSLTENAPANQAQGAVNLGAAFAAGLGEDTGSGDLSADAKKKVRAPAQPQQAADSSQPKDDYQPGGNLHLWSAFSPTNQQTQQQKDHPKYDAEGNLNLWGAFMGNTAPQYDEYRPHDSLNLWTAFSRDGDQRQQQQGKSSGGGGLDLWGAFKKGWDEEGERQRQARALKQ